MSTFTQVSGLIKLHQWATHPGADFRYMVEYHLQQYGNHCCTCVPPEKKNSDLRHVPTYMSVCRLGADDVSAGMLLIAFVQKLNIYFFKSFLRGLLRLSPRNKLKAVIQYKAKYSHSLILRPWSRRLRMRTILAVSNAILS